MTSPEPDRYRLSDDERDEALKGLRTALEEGRLDVEEHEARSHSALRAVTNLDLVELFEDLPPRLRPDFLAPQRTDTAPVPRKSAPVDLSASSEREVDRKKQGPHVGALIGWAGFLAFVWGVPAAMSGDIVAISVFLGVFLLLVVPGLTMAFRHRRREEGPKEIGD
ncbi:DUF1707 domain-containing protein [Nocardiopsis sp. ATB16-24]|uniref:DUF1707 SHOCT-like domain-containing protein n=1 Tax=Nocardiopsis sp. ATB16-24 TaxID=3019555 RepID=UPI002554812D|nr:DUF1707 domain-containing protein [Nocardiopsis sp. ATB16-24]